jgi:hypothetical protein
MAAILVDANAAVITAGGEDAPVAGTVETLTVTTLAGQDWPVLAGAEWFHAIDAVDKGKTSNYEVMRVTATANGTGISWTVTRGDVGTPHAHTAGWTLIPVLTSETLTSASGRPFVPAVRLASANTTDVSSSPPSGAATVDGQAVATGDRVLLTTQSTATDNGVWIANTSGAWTRPIDWDTGKTISDGTIVPVGTVSGNQLFGALFSSSGDSVVGTNDPALQAIVVPAIISFSQPEGTAVQLSITGGLSLEDPNGIGITLNGNGNISLSAGVTVSIGGGDGDAIQMGGGAHYTITPGPGRNIVIGSFSSGNTVVILSLPTADPHVVGGLWNNGGVVNVSAG